MAATPDQALPRGMRLLGFGGLLPFAIALLVGLTSPRWRGLAEMVFIGYSGLILSFIGGARWGRGLAGGAPASRYVEAVVPSLIGLAALLLIPVAGWALALLALGYLIWLRLDFTDPLWSPAYRRMRLQITQIVLVLHAAWLLAR